MNSIEIVYAADTVLDVKKNAGDVCDLGDGDGGDDGDNAELEELENVVKSDQGDDETVKITKCTRESASKTWYFIE